MRKALLFALVLSLISNNLCADVRIAGPELGRYPQRWRVLSLRDLMAEALLTGEFAAVVDPVVAQPLILPAFGRVSSRFGSRYDPFSGSRTFHAGIDIAARAGAAVRAAAAGTVIAAGPMGGCGEGVRIDHGHGLASRACHLLKAAVRRGQRVQAGQRIGWVGQSGRATGPHLHFEVLLSGLPVDPLERVNHW